eukprot:Filipodium_phascolosomae@DN2282_c0_g1_i1.p1
MESERLQKAIQLSQQAAQLDEAAQYQRAFDMYKVALDNWMLVFKYEKNAALKERLGKKIEEYVQRAEQLKGFLHGKQKPETVSTAPQDGSAQQNKGETDDKDEEERCQNFQSAIITEKPNIRWEDVAGLEGAKESLQEAVILPVKYPQLFVGERKPWKGILLYGPPGTGKSFLAKACATECQSTFFSISSSDVISKWLGESEKLVKSLFQMARSNKPAIIFIDEVDSLCTSRSDQESESSRRIKTEFLVQMQGVGKENDGVLVLGATNTPWALDSAIRRRFERRIYIPLPDPAARTRVFQLNVGKTPHDLSEADFHSLGCSSTGYSGADVALAVRDALFEPVRKCRLATHFKRVESSGGKLMWTPCSPTDSDSTITEMKLMDVAPDELLPPPLTKRDFDVALESTRPSVGPEDLQKYEEFTKQFGQEG